MEIGDNHVYGKGTGSLENASGVEVKAKSNISQNDLKGLNVIKEEALLKHHIIVSLEKTPRKVGDIHILPWRDFITNL